MYRGEECVAINMILSEMGVLPYLVGSRYAHYDNHIRKIMDQSFQNLARKNNVMFDKNHASHFTNYFDRKNLDYNKSINEFVKFLIQKFPECASLITLQSINNSYDSDKIVQKIGTQRLLNAIEEYNQMVQDQFLYQSNEYRKNRKTITSEISTLFKNTVHRINKYYELSEFNHYSFETQIIIEELILHFFQDTTVQDQIFAAKNLWNVLNHSMLLNSINHGNEVIEIKNKF